MRLSTTVTSGVGRLAVAAGWTLGALALGRRFVRDAIAVATSPAPVIVSLLISASACAFLGVDSLLGRPWALIVLAVILFVLAGLLMRGVTRE